MNIWEFLGLPKNHRPPNKITMLVKHLKEVSAKNISYPYAAQVKVDGVHCLVVVYKGEAACFTRTGNRMTNTGLIESRMVYVPDGVYMGELTCSAPHSLEELSAVVSPERVNPLDWYGEKLREALYVNWFDWVPLGSFVEGSTKGDWLARYEQLSKRLSATDVYCDILPYTLIYNEEDKDKFTEACIASKEEGAVYRHLGSGWEAGHKNWKIVKEVKGVSYDLLCVGIEEGKGKYKGKVANLLMEWGTGKKKSTIPVMLGKGYTHADACKFFLDPTLVIGYVFKVNALSESSKGKLRLPKVGERRIDKSEGDK